MKRLMITAALVFGFSMGAIAEEASPTVSLRRLSLESANQIALGAVEACRKKGIQIGVTVVDRDGTVQSVMRDTIAAQITVPISRMKAFTAANFNAPTSALKDRADSPIGCIDGLLMSAGGLPVQAGGQLLGGVGVSGALSGETDEACAQAGVDKIIDDLEMEM
ncbi:MAG: heme-binding protein [Candidatus Thiodiazotropha sp. (ex Lucinoma aequizonata)]|nr:heme-binding protein [Candidatus Thiodiazotropha sp. (ex Lucinoma aequizonata)]MCU7887607.1 heme-binding protein [Candidatus Thiodiazotropha sp. (ex Lucinoma aequizonata)]MCU7894812.1 heme-binding protein [Candidatus Thiodiazotropha sp. (ex Lucinoma aequizonata)]MCU7898637.1 heme-binding protein [Candidatus Thiodiazotropha sp. (ex Lucinoma aequizonata)]MCU7903092.1 heme-binding protein [Candidatus Thiodiazotropha sp. (ex Lucinoma aequizonata)]